MANIEDKFSDIPAAASAFSLLAGLSKYADVAASALMRGKCEEKRFMGFMTEVEDIYPTLRKNIIEALVSEEDRVNAESSMRNLSNDKDLIRASLVLDQAHTFVQSLLNADSVAVQMRLNSMRLEMEENTFREQLESSGKAPGKTALYL